MSAGCRNGRVGVLGASSLVGRCLLPRLTQAGWQVSAFSRTASEPPDGAVAWHPLSAAADAPYPDAALQLENWICLAPIWVLPDHFDLLQRHGAQRVVALSSTSRFTKDDSSDPHEQALARRLAQAEARVQAWAQSHGVQWVILRPTLVYGMGRDKNITEIARFGRRFGFFPLLGPGYGLRQPVHAVDVAGACAAALTATAATNRAYNLCGGETLAYRDMVTRVCSALGRRVRLLPVPLWTFRLALALLRPLPRYRQWSIGMAERMSQDLVFDHAEARRDLAFKPQVFALAAADLPA